MLNKEFFMIVSWMSKRERNREEAKWRENPWYCAIDDLLLNSEHLCWGRGLICLNPKTTKLSTCRQSERDKTVLKSGKSATASLFRLIVLRKKMWSIIKMACLVKMALTCIELYLQGLARIKFKISYLLGTDQIKYNWN